jgi:ribosomal protein S18 acetylase RimI-like enzyme
MPDRPVVMFEIREARPQEWARLGDLLVGAYEDLAGGPINEGYAAELRNVGDRAQAAESSVLVAADDEGNLAGAVTYIRGPGTYWSDGDERGDSPSLNGTEAGIRMLAVATPHQRRGIGTALVEACIERASSEGRRVVSLHTMEWMPAAQRMYERLGFVRTPARDWHGERFILLAYLLDLDSR